MADMITGVIIDTSNKTAKVLTVENELKNFYSACGCDCIDIVPRFVDGLRVEVICDDNGLFVDEPFISAVDIFGTAMFVGNIFVVGHDETTFDICSLSEDECKHVLNNVQIMATRKHPEPYPMLTNCEYV